MILIINFRAARFAKEREQSVSAEVMAKVSLTVGGRGAQRVRASCSAAGLTRELTAARVVQMKSADPKTIPGLLSAPAKERIDALKAERDLRRAVCCWARRWPASDSSPTTSRTPTPSWTGQLPPPRRSRRMRRRDAEEQEGAT